MAGHLEGGVAQLAERDPLTLEAAGGPDGQYGIPRSGKGTPVFTPAPLRGSAAKPRIANPYEARPG